MPDLTPPASTKDASWTQVWQLPVLLLGLVLLGVGLFLAYPRYAPPDFDGMLDTVGEYLRAENPAEARPRMDKLVAAGIETQDAGVRGRYYEYLGDHDWLVYADLYPEPVGTAGALDQLKKVNAAYETAEGEFGRTLGGRSMQRWAEALVLLGREDDALSIVDRMDAADAGRRYEIVRGLIERHRRDGDPAAFLRMLDRFERTLADERDKQERLAQRRWAAEVRAGHFLDVGDPQRAIDYINREMQRLRASGAEDSPAMVALLARAYQDTADFDNARRLYGVVQQMVPDSDPLNGRVLVGLAQIELAVGGEGFEERAHTLFSRAAKEHPMTPAYLDAMLGRAHVEAMMGRVAASVDHFRVAIAQLLETTPAWDPRREDLRVKVGSHVDRSIDLEQYDDALDYLSLMLPVYDGRAALPAAMLRQFAEVHERLGGVRLARAESMDPRTWPGPGEPPVAARRNAFQEAAHHFGESAAYYRRHAATATVIDDEAHGRSLWAAAANFDKAQRWSDAIDVYAEYVTTRPGDGDQLRARHHLAKAYMADRQYGSALGIFRDLIDENPQSNWAYASLVPMARCHAATDQPDAAVRVLLSIVDGHPGIRPDSETYREALVDLSRAYYRLGQEDPVYFVSAIERLDTAVERYGHTPDGPVLRYMLADSLRRSSRALGEEARNARAERQRLAFRAERAERLRKAEMYYDQVVTELEARFDAARSDLENLYLRNAYFYKADCAYDRRDFTVAIDRYREAAQRWSDHPASLVAQVQIVNAYCELQEFQQAYVANQNALWQLSQMDDAVFDRPDMPMTRRHWEDWLRWSSELKLLDKQSASAD
ncbi:MAG: tetratricopeptide repeat protein [Planctomycetota bacterium]